MEILTALKGIASFEEAYNLSTSEVVDSIEVKIILQSGKSNDIIKFEAVADGLLKGVISIHAIQPLTRENDYPQKH